MRVQSRVLKCEFQIDRLAFRDSTMTTGPSVLGVNAIAVDCSGPDQRVAVRNKNRFTSEFLVTHGPLIQFQPCQNLIRLPDQSIYPSQSR